ncbi:MAG: Stage V sporulation protein D [Firmicutes bacterium ADurb.Bin456]|nr:MAG: Stage V sporulation protein D [Firmicutes bacterium ADurb.Bin456]
MNHLEQKRLVFLFFVFFICFLGLVWHLFLIQCRDGDLYACLALEQGSQCVALENTPRGRILDRNRLPLTGERTEERVVLFPAAVPDKKKTGSELAGILGLEQENLAAFLSGEPCLLPYGITPGQSRDIREKGWPGVMVLPVQFRYGEQQLAAQVIGHLGKISAPGEFKDLSAKNNKVYHYGDLVGKTGLEMYYEGALKGSLPSRAVRVYTDAAGRLLGGPGFIIEEKTGDNTRRDLILTIDARIQKIVEEIMDRSVPRGAVVILEAGSGDILAMASRPCYHPARPEDYLGAAGENYFLDRCTALFQPGSVFKLVIAAAALEEGTVSLESPFYCHGAGETLLRCWKKEGHGTLTFAQAFAQSCNPVFVRTGLQLGPQRVIDYGGRFGLNNQSILGYPAPGDPRQDLHLIEAPYNLVNSCIGQGPVLVTPIQIASMINTVVSDGLYRQPRLVQEICKSNGTTVNIIPNDPGQRVISPDTAEKLGLLLEMVTEEGTGQGALVPVYGSAGKTGTAQPGDDNSIVNAWFAGYAPRVNPRYVAAILIEGSDSGSVTAAPVFREIMEGILKLD